MVGQLTIMDFLNEDLEVGEWIEDETRVGKMIPFQKLKDFIEKKVVIRFSRQGSNGLIYDYKVVIIKSYRENADHSYRLKDSNKSISNDYLKDITAKGEDIWEIEHTYDKIGYSDDKRHHKENSWVGEIFCSNGRFKPATPHAECFFELTI